MNSFSNKKSAVGPMERAKRKKHARPPRFAALLSLTFSAMVAILVLLASQTDVPQITRAPGTITPLGDYHEIESMEGGIVQTVHVRDGQTVEAGDVLMVLKHPDLKQQNDVLSGQFTAVEHELDNAKAILAALNHSSSLTSADIRDLETHGFSGASAALELYLESQKIQKSSIAQQEETLEILQAAVNFSLERVNKKEEILQKYAKLYDRGLKPINEVLEEEDRLDSLRAAASDAHVRLAEAKRDLSLATAALATETLTLREEVLTQITELDRELGQLKVSLATVVAKLQDLRLVAPARGVVQSVIHPNPGEVIAPGETIFELLPTRQALVVEARIPNSEVGHIGSEHPISVSIDTYDVRKFGKVQGRLQSVSPLPLVDERTGETYFRASIELDDTRVGTGHFQRPLQAGMTVVAEMTTGEKTLLAYMLKPVQLTMERAFNER